MVGRFRFCTAVFALVLVRAAAYRPEDYRGGRGNGDLGQIIYVCPLPGCDYEVNGETVDPRRPPKCGKHRDQRLTRRR